MTDTPPEGEAEWMNRPVFPSEEFGGTRGEVWSPKEAAEVFVGSWLVNDGLGLLRRMANTVLDVTDQEAAGLIVEATDWTQTVSEWMRVFVLDEAAKDTDRGELLRDTCANLRFLGDSIAEHVHRLSPR